MDVFAALAEPTRRDILQLLARQGQLPATAISQKFSVSFPAISQHLRVLREAKLVRVKKRAQQRLYRVDPAAMNELEVWVKQMKDQWEDRFDVLDRVLEEEKSKLIRKDVRHDRSK